MVFLGPAAVVHHPSSQLQLRQLASPTAGGHDGRLHQAGTYTIRARRFEKRLGTYCTPGRRAKRTQWVVAYPATQVDCSIAACTPYGTYFFP